MSQPPLPPGPPSGPPQQYAAAYPSPPRRRNGLVVAMVSASSLVLLVAVIVAGALWMGDRDPETPAAGGGTSSGTPSSSPMASATATIEAPTPPPAPTHTPSPTPTKPPKLTAAEFGGDWDYKLGKTRLRATLKDSWNHRTCAPVEKDGRLTRKGCRYAVEWTYTARGGDLQLTHIVLVFKKPAQAGRVAENMAEADFQLRAGSFLPDWSIGKWRTGTQGEMVVLTLVTAYRAVSESVATDYLDRANTDRLGALLFR